MRHHAATVGSVDPYYSDGRVTVHHGDCLDVLRELPDASVHAVVTDPPYNLSFMAKPWDAYEGHEDAGFAYWLTGLIDGEGHFAIKAHTRGTHAPYFQLKLRADERGVVERIRRSLGVGVISMEDRADANPMVKWTVQDKAGCQRLVDLLDKYPLRAKKQVDYWTWREAVCEWTNRPRGNRWRGQADNTHMAELRDRLMDTRAYTDVPWSGHEFQDWCRLWAAECLRVLKPGGHFLAFGGTRTWHRLACAVEDAGFEVRDSIAWLYGSGFPKSLDVSKAIDKRPGVTRHAGFARHLTERREAAGLSRADVSEAVVGTRTGACWNWEHHQFPEAKWWPALRDLLDLDDETWGPVVAEAERQKIGERTTGIGTGNGSVRIMGDGGRDLTANATPAAEQWAGWGTALKPAFEPIVVARKPLTGTIAGNVLAHGTGALNIDACRVAHGDDLSRYDRSATSGMGYHGVAEPTLTPAHPAGRWPANVALDDTQAAELDRQTMGQVGSNSGDPSKSDGSLSGVGDVFPRPGRTHDGTTYDQRGDFGASRFFPTFRYQGKAPTAERPRVNGTAHPTVKPLDLMRWLVRLVTPPGGTVLEPFAGSGATVEAALIEGFDCIAIEREAEYLPLIRQRINRRRDPVSYIETAGEDLGLFDLDQEEPA